MMIHKKILFSLSVITLSLTKIVFAGLSDVSWDGYEQTYINVLDKSCASIRNKPREELSLAGWVLSQKMKNVSVYQNEVVNKELKIKKILRNGKLKGLRYTFFERSLPKLYLVVSKKCEIEVVRLIERDNSDRIKSISSLSNDLKVKWFEEHVNPDVPALNPPIGVKVALIDTGVNYLIPKISARLSRVNERQLLGYDFEDEDNKPFDMDFVGSPFFPRHHGTSVASLFIKEAPKAQLVPYRFSRSDPCKFKDIVKHINANAIRIVAIPMGSLKKDIWDCFYESASKHNHILFIVSAGNNGIDIDKKKVFPASFPLDNLVVVSSSTIFGTLPQGSNYGKVSVDFLIPAEHIEVIDHRAVRTLVSGSSYAVPRLAALVARYLRKNREASVAEIRRFLIARAVEVDDKIVQYGWIPDPLDDYLF